MDNVVRMTVVIFHPPNTHAGHVEPNQHVTIPKGQSFEFLNNTDWPVTVQFPAQVDATVAPQPIPPKNCAPNNRSVVTIGPNAVPGSYDYTMGAGVPACPLCETSFQDPMTLDVRRFATIATRTDPIIIITPEA